MYLSSSDEMSESEETPKQGNLLMDIVEWLGAAQSVAQQQVLVNNFSLF